METNATPELEQFDQHILQWFFWKVVTPYVIMMAAWPIYRYIMDVPDAFSKAFAHGELLIFAALVLIEVSLEGAEARGKHVRSFGGRAMSAFLEALKVIAVLIIFCVGFMKFDVMKLDASKLEAIKLEALRLGVTKLDALQLADVTISAKLTAYSCLSCSVALLAVALSLLGVIRAMRATATGQLQARGVNPR